MKLSSEEISEVMEIQKRLEAKIATYRKEIKQLEKNWEILDRAITESSFTSAADMLGSDQNNEKSNHNDKENDIYDNTYVAGQEQRAVTETITKEEKETSAPTPIIIKDSNTGRTVASAYKTADYISIIMAAQDDDAPAITEDAEPFGSFFLERILGGMQKKDAEDIQNSTIPAQSALDYDVESDPDTGLIRSITIRNYRDERRATEIINTAGWSFTRMLEGAKTKTNAASTRGR